MKLISKISVKTCDASPEMELVEIEGKQVPRAKGVQHLLRVVGIATGTKNVTTDFGTSICVLGSFQATNVKTGEIYRGSKCYLPETAAGLIAGAFGEAVEQLEFAFDIGCKPAKTATGYEFTVTPLVDVTENDPVALLTAKLAAAAPALPAPKTAQAQTEPAQESEQKELATEGAPAEETKSAGKKK